MVLARKRLKKRGYGFLEAVRVAPIILVIQYSKGLELVKTKLLGMPTERR